MRYAVLQQFGFVFFDQGGRLLQIRQKADAFGVQRQGVATGSADFGLAALAGFFAALAFGFFARLNALVFRRLSALRQRASASVTVPCGWPN